MKRFLICIAAILVTLPAFGQVRSHTHRPPQTYRAPQTHHYRPPAYYHHRPYYNYSPYRYYGPYRPYTPYRPYRPYTPYMPYNYNSFTFGTTIGVYGTMGYVVGGVRYVPPVAYDVTYPVAPTEVVSIPEGTVIIVDNVAIMNKNGRITVYKVEENGQQ